MAVSSPTVVQRGQHTIVTNLLGLLGKKNKIWLQKMVLTKLTF